jgi:hypothetical protein
MMDTNEQVILVLKLVLNIAPPALYFVILGLVNSQSRPHLISSRNDWLALTVVFLPVILFPVFWLAATGLYAMAVMTILLAVVVLYASLPKSGSGWVIYNCSREHVCNVLLKSLDKIGIDYEINTAELICLPKEGVELRISGLALLRNTTISIYAENPESEVLQRLEKVFNAQLGNVECAMNPSGPAMLIAGTSMLILPLLMMVRHMDAFVRVVSDLFPL